MESLMEKYRRMYNNGKGIHLISICNEADIDQFDEMSYEEMLHQIAGINIDEAKKMIKLARSHPVYTHYDELLSITSAGASPVELIKQMEEDKRFTFEDRFLAIRRLFRLTVEQAWEEIRASRGLPRDMETYNKMYNPFWEAFLRVSDIISDETINIDEIDI